MKFFCNSLEVGVSYSDIVENSIDEIVATSYAEKLGVFVSESEIDNAICEYEAINKEAYDKALKIYGETTLKQKLKDRASVCRISTEIEIK